MSFQLNSIQIPNYKIENRKSEFRIPNSRFSIISEWKFQHKIWLIQFIIIIKSVKRSKSKSSQFIWCIVMGMECTWNPWNFISWQKNVLNISYEKTNKKSIYELHKLTQWIWVLSLNWVHWISKFHGISHGNLWYIFFNDENEFH